MKHPGVWVMGDLADDDRKHGMGIVVEYAGQQSKPQWIKPKPFRWDYTQFGEANGAPAALTPRGANERFGGLGRCVRHLQARKRQCYGKRVVQRSGQWLGKRRRGRCMDGKRRPAVDENGDIYVVTGNGPYNPQFALDQLGESVVHLIWNPGNPGSLVVADWFTPFRDVDRDGSHKDQDLAAGGVIAL